MTNASKQETKKCPHCAEEILAEAKKCKHCGEFIDPKLRPNPNGVKPKSFGLVATKIACPNCGYEGKPKAVVKGTMLVELILLLFFIVPGLIYSAWRSSSRHYVCPKCGCKEINEIESA